MTAVFIIFFFLGVEDTSEYRSGATMGAHKGGRGHLPPLEIFRYIYFNVNDRMHYAFLNEKMGALLGFAPPCIIFGVRPWVLLNIINTNIY